MKRTSWFGLVASAAVGGGLALAVQVVLASRGMSVLVIPLSLSAVSAVMGFIVVGLAWPIRERLYSDVLRPRLDPLYSVRVVLLAKASAVTGSLFVGATMGFLGFALTRPVLSSDQAWFALAGLVGAIVLMVGGMLAEKWCVLPPESGVDDSTLSPGGETA